jgi:tubulin polyglutamylase TTLL9
VIGEVLRSTEGFQETADDHAWDFAWISKDFVRDVLDTCLPMQAGQLVNHFRNYYELTRKDLLAKNLKRTRRQFARDNRPEAARYDFFPTSFCMPSEYALFIEEFKRNPGVWIMKPIGKSQGKGIFLFNRLSQIQAWKQSFTEAVAAAAVAATAMPSSQSPRAPGPESGEQGPDLMTFIVQRYIEHPLLIGGRKFDLRVYALVLSYTPLVVYLYRSGFARFTHHRYTLEDITDTFIHLTNVAIQKHSDVSLNHTHFPLFHLSHTHTRFACGGPRHTLESANGVQTMSGSS